MTVFEDVRNATRIPLPTDGYLFRYGAAMYAVAYLEHDLKFKCKEIAALFNLHFTLYKEDSHLKDKRVLKTTGALFEDMARLLKQSKDSDLVNLRKELWPLLELTVFLRNALAHGSPGTDVNDDNAQKLFRSSKQANFTVTDEKMDELILHASAASEILSKLGYLLKWKKYNQLTGKTAPFRKLTEAEVEEMLKQEELINGSD